MIRIAYVALENLFGTISLELERCRKSAICGVNAPISIEYLNACDRLFDYVRVRAQIQEKVDLAFSRECVLNCSNFASTVLELASV